MADLWLILVVTSAICGLAGYVFAKKTGRNPALWVTIGIVFNIIALVILMAVGGRRKATIP
jgi:hypothetical protein